MSLIKDGKVYRTYDEQVDHLTEEHLKQLDVNKNVISRFNDVDTQLRELGVAANLGGYNFVRFSFARQGEYYQFNNTNVSIEDIASSLNATEGDYVEITSENIQDIPAYGYCDGNNNINIAFKGDYMAKYNTLNVRNVAKNKVAELDTTSLLSSFGGTSLNDYDPNTHKKQVFNIIDDLTFGGQGSQYVSFDLNNDGKYNFVFIGGIYNGKDGKCVYSTNGTNWAAIRDRAVEGDSVVVTDNVDISELTDAQVGDVFAKQKDSTYIKTGNIRGPKGDKGERGEQGIQGATGETGRQGERGEKGEKGEQGVPGTQGLTIHTGIYSSKAELPPFDSTQVNDAYRVSNTSGQIVTTDLYFHAADGSDWDVQTNWGGVKGDKGDPGVPGKDGEEGPIGPTGPEGPEGPAGPRGEKGEKGEQGVPGVTPTFSSPIFDILDGGLWKTELSDWNYITPSILGQPEADIYFDNDEGNLQPHIVMKNKNSIPLSVTVTIGGGVGNYILSLLQGYNLPSFTYVRNIKINFTMYYPIDKLKAVNVPSISEEILKVIQQTFAEKTEFVSAIFSMAKSASITAKQVFYDEIFPLDIAIVDENTFIFCSKGYSYYNEVVSINTDQKFYFVFKLSDITIDLENIEDVEVCPELYIQNDWKYQS